MYSTHADVPLLPASAEKLPVSFAALRLLGPSYRFRTEVVGDGEKVGHAWDGDLDLVGYGDPTLAESDLSALARDVARWGIGRVSGRVVADESYFDARRDAPGWKPSYVGIESRPLSALSVEGARFAGANGSAAAAARMFTAALERRGVSVRGAPEAGSAADDAFALAVDYSDPLVDIVREMNQRERQLRGRDGAEGARSLGRAARNDDRRRAGGRTRATARRHSDDRRPHRRRLGPLAPRPPHARRARRHPPRRRRPTRRSATPS